MTLAAIAAIAVAAAIALWPRSPEPRVAFAGPLQISNQTTTPVTVSGTDFAPGARVRIDGRDVGALSVTPTSILALVPPIETIAPELVRARVKVEVTGAQGSAEITVVNDRAFATPRAIAAANGRWAVVSPTTDELWISGAVFAGGDGPRDVVPYADGWAVVVEQEGAVRLVGSDGALRRAVAVGGRPQAMVIDPERPAVAYVSELAGDRVVELDLERGTILRAIDVPPNPRALAIAGRTLWVSALGADSISAIDLGSGEVREVEVGPGASILGGPTGLLGGQVMGGRAGRSLVATATAVFAATTGPNLGPNAERISVSTNGGVSVIYARTRAFLRHVPIDAGLPQGLALDPKRERLYVADVARGRIFTFDARKLVESDAAARTAELSRLEVEVPPNVPRARPDAPASMHAGPWAMAIDGDRLLVLQRFLRVVDVYDASGDSLVRVDRIALGGPEPQPLRRLGETLYHTTLGPFRLTCDGCHPDGRDGGIMFTKPDPMRIYRSPSIRTAHDSAPFFTPARFPSLRVVNHELLTQFRPPSLRPTPNEVMALTEHTLAMTAPPSPFAGQETVALPGEGRSGRPAEGKRLFEGKGQCATQCHPPPHFTSDQAPETRGRLYDVGTGAPLPLGVERQDPMEPGRPPPSLLGVWDNHPLLLGGTAGFRVEGARVVADPRPALRTASAHGAFERLSEQERDDLLAYLLTL